jgi:hypothetical protein
MGRSRPVWDPVGFAVHYCLKSFTCNIYGPPRKRCKQKTYGQAKPFRCNTYRKHGGGLRPLQRATRRSYLAAALKPFPFILLRTLLHRAKSQPLYFQAFPHSLPKNTRGGGTSSFSIEAPSQLWDGTFPSVPLRRKAFGATICKGTGFLHHPGKQLRSPRCLRLRERTSGTVYRRSRSQVVPGSGVLTRVSGFVLTNPEQVKRTDQQGGSSTHLIKDAGKTRAGKAGSVRLG